MHTSQEATRFERRWDKKIIMKSTVTFIATAILGLSGAAHAVTVNGSQFTNGLSSQTISGVSFSAIGGKFEKKAAGPVMGVGITSDTSGEIDIDGEAIRASFATLGAQHVSSFTLGLLYNGPEYSDVLEVAKVTVNGNQNYYLKATATEDVAQWFKGNTLLGNVNYTYGTQAGVGAVVKVNNPFGNLAVTSVKFSAVAGVDLDTCGPRGRSDCTNQSDYNLVQLATAPIPEPGTYAMLLAGLLTVGFVVRRRSTGR